MAVFRNVMVYLGLGPDEEYEDGYLYEDEPLDDMIEPDRRRSGGYAAAGPEYDTRGPAMDDATASAVGAVRPLRPVEDPDERRPTERVLDLTAQEDYFDDTKASEVQRVPVASGGGSENVHMIGREPAGGQAFGADAGSRSGRVDPVVRAVPIQRTKPLAIVPETFADARLIGDEFKRSVPVIMNLQGLDRELARRLIDFASGVCYSLNGSMEKIASQVFLLTPDSVEISEEDLRRIEERGYTR